MLSVTPIFKRVLCPIFLCISLFLIAQPSLALTVQDIPNPRQLNRTWVADTANLLTANTEVKLNRLISTLEEKNTCEIAVVTVPETAPAATPKEFATELFNYWHIGKYGKNNGVLFLISRGDRRVEIETGYGLTKILPDAMLVNLIQQKITPEFKQGHFDEGTLAGTEALIASLQKYKPPYMAKPVELMVVAIVLIMAGIGLWMMLSALRFHSSKYNRKIYAKTSSYGVSGTVDFSDSSGVGNYGGFGGGSSGGDGGGGGFGGGDGGADAGGG